MSRSKNCDNILAQRLREKNKKLQQKKLHPTLNMASYFSTSTRTALTKSLYSNCFGPQIQNSFITMPKMLAHSSKPILKLLEGRGCSAQFDGPNIILGNIVSNLKKVKNSLNFKCAPQLAFHTKAEEQNGTCPNCQKIIGNVYHL